MTKLAGMTALALLASLTACGSSDQPAPDKASAAEITMDGPFADAEMAMDRAMRAAAGVDAADSWVQKMIAHHEGAIAMSRIVLGLEPTAEVTKMAQTTIDSQSAEIEALKARARTGAADPKSAELYDAATSAMHSEMMAASGATPSETYLAKMLAHHRGAVAMSEVALANGATGGLRAQINETRTEQSKEVAMVEAMLRGEPMTTQPKETTVPVPSAKASNAAAPKAAASTAAAPKQVPKPAATKPASGQPAAPEAAPTCLPEHRAAGHC